MELPIVGTAQKAPHGKDTSPARDLIHFRAHTRPALVKSVGSSSADWIGSFVGVGSSTLEDLSGDRMEQTALEDMTNLQPGDDGLLPICFIDHNYSLLQHCIMGGIEDKPQLRWAEYPDLLSGMNKPVAIITIQVAVTAHNPIAAEIFSYIRAKLKIGISVGCQVVDYDYICDADGYVIGLIILRILPLEFSTVGIPCNKESYVTDAVKGLFEQSGLNVKASKAIDLAKMADSWTDFSGLDQLILRRLNKAVTRMKAIGADRVTDFSAYGESERTLKAISAVVEPLGLGLHRLADVAQATPNSKLFTARSV